MTETELELLDDLDEALGHLLAARVRVAGLDAVRPDPGVGIDVALAQDAEVRTAWNALQALLDRLADEQRTDVLDIEAAATAHAAACALTGWRLGMMARGGTR